MNDIVRFGISLPKGLLRNFDRLISIKGYANRSEAIRDLLREHLVEQEWEKGEKETVATISIVYDHRKRELANTLISLQHQHHPSILSVLHTHLDEHNCLEVAVVKGKPKKIKKIADKLISTKGVKFGKLTPATLGKDLN